MSTNSAKWKEYHLKVFISYSKSNEITAKSIMNTLKDYSIDSFVADFHLNSNDEWHPRIINQLSSAELCICLISSEYNKSASCNQELGFTLISNKPTILISTEKEVFPIGMMSARQSQYLNAHDPELIHNYILNQILNLNIPEIVRNYIENKLDEKIKNKSLTFYQAFFKMMSEKKLRDQASYISTFKLYINPFLGSKSINSHNKQESRNFSNYVITLKKSESNKNKIFRVYKILLNYLFDHKLIERFYYQDLKLKVEKPNEVIMEYKEMGLMIEKMNDYKYYPILKLIYTTGLRRGEVLAINKKNLHFSKDKLTIKINNTFDSGRKKLNLKKPIIVELNDSFLLNYLKNEATPDTNGYVFTTKGLVIEAGSLSTSLNKYFKKNSQLKSITFNQIRTSFQKTKQK